MDLCVLDLTIKVDKGLYVKFFSVLQVYEMLQYSIRSGWKFHEKYFKEYK